MNRLVQLLVVTCCMALPALSLAQTVQPLSEIKPPARYENIHVHKLSTDEHSTSFIIWVKQSVKAHKHEHHSETLYVLEGMGKMDLGGSEKRIRPGDFIFIPKGTIHSLEVISSNPVKVISVQAPEFFGKDRVFVD